MSRKVLALGVFVAAVAMGCSFNIDPDSGPPGSTFRAFGAGVEQGCPPDDDADPPPSLTFVAIATLFDPDGVEVDSASGPGTPPDGAWSVTLTVPADATPGDVYRVEAVCQVYEDGILQGELEFDEVEEFTVTEGPPGTTTTVVVSPSVTESGAPAIAVESAPTFTG